jgi:hypothetical protein
MTPPDDEFYVGYEPVLPPGLRARLRRAGAAGAVVIAAVTLAALLGHARLSPSRFDFGRPREVSGVLERRPYPAITTAEGRSWLVGQGKHAADAAVAGIADGPVRLRGTAIVRGRHTMFEVVPGSASAAAVVAPAPGAVIESVDDAAREVALTGEIVDSKCFLGVMNPGQGTVHRDCATLCLRGGIPPMLRVHDAAGGDHLVLLVGRDGRAMSRELAPLAGVPVQVRGRLVRDGRGLVLAADVGDYERLGRRPRG